MKKPNAYGHFENINFLLRRINYIFNRKFRFSEAKKRLFRKITKIIFGENTSPRRCGRCVKNWPKVRNAQVSEKYKCN